MTDREPPARPTPSLEDVAARLDKVRAREATDERAQENRRGTSQGAGLAMRIGMELVVAVMVGLGLGWFIDKKLGTTPIFILAMVTLGFATGMLNVVRLSRGLAEREALAAKTVGKETAPPPRPIDDDDDE